MKTFVKTTTFSVLACFSIGSEGYSTLRMGAESGIEIAPTTSSLSSRRGFFSRAISVAGTSTFLSTAITFGKPLPSSAIGPTKIELLNPIYSAAPCPPSKPIPGEKAMKGMRGLCVTVKADLKGASPKELKDVGVYGFVTDAVTGDSVLANNPDLSTDAGQFSMVPSIKTTDKAIEFEFVAAVPMEKDVSQFDNGIGELSFESLRVIDFPGGQQYGEISPCEMNEFSAECDAWEEENGPYVRKDFMVKSNPRTKGR